MFKKISYILLGMTLMVGGTVLAAPYFTYQRTLLPETNNAFDLGTTTSVWRDLFVTQICLSGDCKSAWPTGGSGTFAWTSNSWGNSTTSTIGFLTGGLFTNASSTFGANTYFSSLSQGFAFIGSAGKLSSIASSSVNLSWFNNDSGFLTSVAPTDLNSADFGDFTCNGTSCTLDTTYLTSYTSPYEIATGTIAVSDLAFFGKTSGRTTLEGVATTTLTASSPLSLSNPVVKVGGSNSVLTLDTSGSWTGSAGSVANALTAGTGLTSAGTYNGATTRTFSLDTANANSWSVLQTFNYSSSTAYSSFVTASSTQWIGGGLQACNATTGKLNWDSTTNQFKCDTDQTGGSSFTGAINSVVTTDSSGNLIATGTQLTVGNIIATTSANSIFSGNIIAAGDGVQYLGGPAGANRFYVTAYGITDGNTTQSPGQFKWQSGTGGTNIQSSAFNMGSAIVFGWSSGDVNAVPKDTALSRLSAGRIAVGNGSANDVTGGLSMAYSSTTYASFTTASSTFSINSSVDILDFLKFPVSSSPTMTVAGRIALDSTSNNLVLATSTNGHIVVASATTTLYSFVASTTAITSGTIIDMPSHPLQQVVSSLWCKVSSGTSIQIFISDGTNDTNTITCTTTGTQYAITTNNIFTSYEGIRMEYGTKTGDTGYLSVRVMGYRIAD